MLSEVNSIEKLYVVLASKILEGLSQEQWFLNSFSVTKAALVCRCSNSIGADVANGRKNARITSVSIARNVIPQDNHKLPPFEPSCWCIVNNTSKVNDVELLIDNMEFEQVITQEFDADDVDIFAELGGSQMKEQATLNPLQSILLEEENEFVDVDPQLVAELLQVLAQHTIRQQSNNENNAFPESVQNVDMNSAELRTSMMNIGSHSLSNCKTINKSDHVFEQIIILVNLTLLKSKIFPQSGSLCTIS